jgi:hypothetical protein
VVCTYSKGIVEGLLPLPTRLGSLNATVRQSAANGGDEIRDLPVPVGMIADRVATAQEESGTAVQGRTVKSIRFTAANGTMLMLSSSARNPR